MYTESRSNPDLNMDCLQMTTHKLIIFKHNSNMGKTSAHKLLDLIKVMLVNRAIGTVITFAYSNVKLNEIAKSDGIMIEEII
jgi:hypothetical protein